jgi:stress response protein YsnF
VPTRHEEVSVERVPVEEGAATTEAQRIGEVRVPLTEEEEVRIRKNVVEDTEVVEED